MNEALYNQRILITGGLGFIGSNLARRLVDLGAHVTLVDSLIPEYGGNLFNIAGIEDRVQVNISDVRDAHSMDSLVPGHDYIFNLAGQTSHMDSMSDPITDLEINAKAQLSILETCRQKNPQIRIVFASTRQIYGRPQYLPVDEKHPLDPTDINGINKTAGEWYNILYHRIYGIKTSVLRLTNTYGPRMRIKDDRQTFLGIWIKRILEGAVFEVWEGTQLRDFNYIEDVIDAFVLAATDSKAIGKVFNLGSNEIVSLLQLAKLLVNVSDRGHYKILPFPEERKKIDIGSYYSCFDLIKNTLGWFPKTSLVQGIRETIKYFDKYGAHYI